MTSEAVDDLAAMDRAWEADESSRREHWTTAVGWGVPHGKHVAGYPLVDLSGHITYGQALFLVLRQELPDLRKTQMLETCLTALIDHGFRNTVAVTARFAAS